MTIILMVIAMMSGSALAETLIPNPHPGIPNPNPQMVENKPNEHQLINTRANIRSILIYGVYCKPLTPEGKEMLDILNGITSNLIVNVRLDPELEVDARAVEVGEKLFGKEATCKMYKEILQEKGIYKDLFTNPDFDAL